MAVEEFKVKGKSIPLYKDDEALQMIDEQYDLRGFAVMVVDTLDKEVAQQTAHHEVPEGSAVVLQVIGVKGRACTAVLVYNTELFQGGSLFYASDDDWRAHYTEVIKERGEVLLNPVYPFLNATIVGLQPRTDANATNIWTVQF